MPKIHNFTKSRVTSLYNSSLIPRFDRAERSRVVWRTLEPFECLKKDREGPKELLNSLERGTKCKYLMDFSIRYELHFIP